MPSPCILCRAPIRNGANFCTECDTYQDWRRHFGVSNTVLSLLVALVSVLTVAVPVVRNALTPERSDVRCSLLHWEESEVTIVVSNRGTRPAVIKGLRLTPTTSAATKPPVVFQADFPETILEPDKFRTLSFHRVIGATPASLEPIATFRPGYKLDLMIFPFASESDSVSCENWEVFNE